MFFNESFILLEFEIALNVVFFPPSTESSAQVAQKKSAGASVADSSMLTLIKLQSISTKCQETPGPSAI